MEERKGKRIIMFPIPFPGHFNPMIQLAGIFHHHGFSVTILHTSFNFPDPSRHPHFTFRTITHNKEGEEEGEDPLSQSKTSSMDLVALVRLLKQSYAEPFRQSLATEVSGGETVCCLVSDAIWGRNTEVAAEEIGVGRMVLRTGAAASFCVFAAFPLLKDKGYLPFQGHLTPMIQLARIFHNRGFSITILHTSFNFPDPSHYPLFTFRTIPHNNEGGEDPLTQPEASSMDLVAFMRLLRQTYENPFRRSLAVEVGKGDTSSCCLVSDVVWEKHAEFAAEEVGIDRMVFVELEVLAFSLI